MATLSRPPASCPDPELVPGKAALDLHSLRAIDSNLDTFVANVSHRAARLADDALKQTEVPEALAGLGGAVLVTGGAGYLGAALCMCLSIKYVGVDIVDTKTVQRCHHVADVSALQLSSAGCAAVLHTAALHAPHATTCHLDEFFHTNVDGARAVLS